MKMKYRLAALLSAAAVICPSLPVSADVTGEHPLFSWRTVSGDVILNLQPLEDNGIFGEGWRGQLYYTHNNHTVKRVTRNDSENHEYFDNRGPTEPLQGQNREESDYDVIETDTLYRIAPRNDCLSFHLRSGADEAASEAKMSEILRRYFPDMHDYVYLKSPHTEEAYSADFSEHEPYQIYDITVHNNALRTEERAAQIMSDLYDAGLIDAFYTWGETADFNVFGSDLSCYYPVINRVSPETGQTEAQTADWDAVEAWLKENYPDCSLDHSLSPDERYTVSVPARMTFDKRFSLAVRLFEEFGISPIADVPASEPHPLLGDNQLTVSQYGSIGVMYERIARWQKTTVDQCLVVSDRQFLTPTKPYEIHRVRFSPYRVISKEGTSPDWYAIFTQWTDTLRRGGYPEDVLQHFSYEVLPKYAMSELDNIDSFRTTQDAWAQYSILDVLKAYPDIEKVEAQFGYRTDSRPNNEGDFCIVLPGTAENKPSLPLENIRSMQYSENGACWRILLDTADDSAYTEVYAAYFNAMKQLLADSRYRNASLSYSSTELADASGDASFIIPEYETLFDRSDALKDYIRRIAGWENTTPDKCIVISDFDTEKPQQYVCELLTPTKHYLIGKEQCSPYRFYTDDGTAVDRDKLLEKWRKMLKNRGYSGGSLDAMLEKEIGGMELEASEGGYLVKNVRESYSGLTLVDCLKNFPQVMRVEATYRYMTYDRVNESGNYRFSFTSERKLTEADFPELPGAKLEKTDDYPYPDIYSLTLPESDYASYFKAMPYLQSLSYVQNPVLAGSATEMEDPNADTPMILGYETVYSRPYMREKADDKRIAENGDINQDSYIDVSDAVLLARFTAEDHTVRLSQKALAGGADLNGDGEITALDVIEILRYIAKK